MPPCVTWLDFSVARTAGATTQQIMASLSREGVLDHRETLILGGVAAFRHSARSWEALLAAMASASSCSSSSARIAVQLRDEAARELWQSWLPAVRKLRKQQAACGCKVVVTTRVREPVAHYLSAYLWATRFKPDLGTSIARPRTQLVNGKSYSVLPRPSFFEWSSRASNLQARLFLYGGASAFISDEQSGRPDSKNQPKPPPHIESEDEFEGAGIRLAVVAVLLLLFLLARVRVHGWQQVLLRSGSSKDEVLLRAAHALPRA